MMISINRSVLIATMFVSLCFPGRVAASASSTDQSDLWWNPNESGWGIQVVERGTRMFATLYVYGNSSQPTWYTALMDSQGGSVWSGDLYASTGSWFGAVPYDTAAFAGQKVGTMTWSAVNSGQATLTYSVNGVNVSKSVVRTYIATDNFVGAYAGAIYENSSNCSNQANNGASKDFAALAIDEIGTSTVVGLALVSGANCKMTGMLSQSGQFGQLSGTYTCASGESGNFSMSEMSVGPNSLTINFSNTSATTGCLSTGYFSGIRVQP